LQLTAAEEGGGISAEDVARGLESVERAVRDAEARLSASTTAHTQTDAEALRARLTTLDERSARFQLATATAARLAGEQPVPTTQREVLALRDQISERELALATRRQMLERERESLQRTAAEMAEAGSHIEPELLRLSRELGAELLVSRFEDVEPGSAGWVEAKLGPLVQALLVDDPEAAAAALAKVEHARNEVLLVRAHTELALTPPSDAAESRAVVCEEPFGVRVTRVPERPALGRRAREQALAELHASLDRYGAALDELHADAQRLAAQRRDADLLLTHVEVLAAGDPASERARIGEQLLRLDELQAQARDAAAAARAELLALRPRLSGLRRLLPEAQLLSAADYGERAHQLNQRLQQLTAARAELARLAAPRAQLAELLDVLRRPPPDEHALAAAQARASALDATRERLFRARAALEEVAQHAYAEAFGDPDSMLAALAAEAALAPALEEQHAAARAAVQAADASEREADQAWEAATAELTQVNAERAVLAAQLERGEAELATWGAPPTPEELEHAAHELERARSELTQLEREQRAEVAERARTAERRAQAERELTRARAHTAAVSGEAAPLAEAWRALRAEVEAQGLQHAAAADETRSSSQLRAEAASKRELLCDRLARARGGEELRALLEASEQEPNQLHAWQAVREWLRRRVPAQIAEVDDPLLALERLRDHLSVLEGRLQRQEGDLRGASEDVARGVDVQLRRAQAQVRRLNQQLEGIRFGSVHGIRVEMRRIERMEQILRALRAGEAQELLFSSSLPIEEALEEIFKRFGGGGKSGGQRLLDYREYVELAVEIRRQTGPGWEPASPTRLSTGEAIGVGAALMMVVLTEWERDANLFRARGAIGSLRCLFLDEANRLSRDNLGVLFDLCRSLDLQLLVAAPEVARADGNTTYRLVRHVSDDGREEVIVSGRRAVSPQPEAAADEGTPECAEA
jgi:chromosome partition protein MukB